MAELAADATEVVALYGIGMLFGPEAAMAALAGPDLDHVAAELCARTKAEFDPTGRLNPGRSVVTEVAEAEWI